MFKSDGGFDNSQFQKGTGAPAETNHVHRYQNHAYHMQGDPKNNGQEDFNTSRFEDIPTTTL